MSPLFKIGMEYVYQLISLVKRWFNHFGLALDGQNQEDLFYQLLHDKNYDDALKLALQYKYLDIDLVYKFKWRNSGITIQLINNVLGKIQDKLWAIYECVQTVPMSYEACRCLLEFGLREANLRLLYELGNEPNVAYPEGSKHDGKLGSGAKTPPPPPSKRYRDQEKQPLLDDDIDDEAIMGLIDFEHLNDQQKELCRCRQNLIRYEHSLKAYEEILGDYRTIQHDFDHVFYDEFRRKPPLHSCIDFANIGDPHAVETCLDFYTTDLKSHLLALLSNFPETMSPYQYRNLLPCLRGHERVFEWRSLSGGGSKVRQDRQDWSSRDKDSALGPYLKDRNETFAKEFYDKNEYLRKYLKAQLTSELLTQWFIERAMEIEQRTLLLSGAIQLLNLGLELNIEQLKETHDDLLEFDRIVYDCCSENNIYLSYGEFIKMPEIERLLLMTGDSLKTCKDRFRFYIIPYLHRRNTHTLASKTTILSEYFRRLAHSREQICRTIYNDLLDRIECDNFVADWTSGMDDAIDEIGEEIKRIERNRQANQVSTMASQTFALGDLDECYEACQLIMKKDFKECWALCCQLGMHTKYTNNEAKYKLLAYALANCNDVDDPEDKVSVKILNYVVELRKRDPKIQMAYLKRNM